MRLNMSDIEFVSFMYKNPANDFKKWEYDHLFNSLFFIGKAQNHL